MCKTSKVLDAHLPPKARVFKLLFQSLTDVRVTLEINRGLQTLPDAAHLFDKGNTHVITMLYLFPERIAGLEPMIPRAHDETTAKIFRGRY